MRHPSKICSAIKVIDIMGLVSKACRYCHLFSTYVVSTYIEDIVIVFYIVINLVISFIFLKLQCVSVLKNGFCQKKSNFTENLFTLLLYKNFESVSWSGLIILIIFVIISNKLVLVWNKILLVLECCLIQHYVWWIPLLHYI